MVGIKTESVLESQADWLDEKSPHYWRFQQYKKLLQSLVNKQDRVLDVGCGEGNLLFY